MAEFVKTNEEGARALFNKRLVYNQRAGQPTNPVASGPGAPQSALVDFLAEKVMYGRVSRLFTPIAIGKAQHRNLRSFAASVDPEKSMRALNFVVDAFEDMAQQFQKCALSNKIHATDQHLSQLKVYKAFVNPITQYQAYMKKYIASFRVNVNSDPQRPLETFDQLEGDLLRAVALNGRRTPVTYPAYIKSRRCPIAVSGLAIEIAQLDASNDEDKVQQFLDSPNWDFFVSTAATYGFMIDKAVPWRLVADIGSSPMIEYARAYGANTTDGILARYYAPAQLLYYATFAQRMLSMYNGCIPPSILYTQECNGKVVLKQKLPDRYGTVDRLKSLYDASHFLELYCKLRFEEEESPYSEEEREQLIDEVVEVSQFSSATVALARFERILNKTFDYSGSLGYYNKWNKQREDSAELTSRASTETYGQIPQEY